MANISVDSLGLQQSIVDDLKSRGINEVPEWVKQFAQHPNFASRGPEVLQKILMPGFAKNARSLSNDMLPPGWTHDINTGVGAVYTEPSNARRGGATYNFPYEFSGYKRGADRETQLPIWGDAERAYAQYAMFNKLMSTHQSGPFYSAEGLMQMAPSLAAIAAPALMMGAAGAFSGAPAVGSTAGGATGLDLLANNVLAGGEVIGSTSPFAGFTAAPGVLGPSAELGLSELAPYKLGTPYSVFNETGTDLLANNIPGATNTASSVLGNIGKYTLPISIGASALGSIISSKEQSDAYKDAAKAQAKQNQNAIDALMEMYQTTRGDLEPWVTAGTGDYGLSRLTGGMTIDENDPIYQWKQNEAARIVNQALAARGLWNSRPGINALSEAGMKVSSEEADKQWQRAYEIARMGQNSAAQSGTIGAQTAGNVADVYTNTGAQNAASALGQGNAMSNLWSGLGTLPLNALMLYGYGKQSGLWG